MYFCVCSFNQKKDGQTCRNSSTNTNFTTISEHKLREAYGLKHPESWWEEVAVGDKGTIGDTSYQVMEQPTTNSGRNQIQLSSVSLLIPYYSRLLLMVP